MADHDDTSGLHHVELHTKEPDSLLNLFVHTYGFNLVATRMTNDFRQWLLESHQCRLLISSVESNMNITNNNKDDYDILTTIIQNQATRELIVGRNTVFNVALNVKSVQAVIDRDPDVQVIISPRQAVDEHGSIEYACIKSCVGNVVHTLLDDSHYCGPYLPGFEPAKAFERQRYSGAIVRGIDHVAFALKQHSALSMIAWYERVLGMKRFRINQQDDSSDGFAVRVGTRGLRLFASEYWKCAEIGCANGKPFNLKFVFGESLIDINSGLNDQITTFIKKHNGQEGIQHMALTCVNGIKDAVRLATVEGAQFLSPSPSYYLTEYNGRVIEAAGESATELGKLGILLDDEADQENLPNDQSITTKKVLLQIFTKSIFNNDTFFLEFIERQGAKGFGAGNVRTLCKIVLQQMNLAVD